MNAREIVSSLKGRWYGQYGSVVCPCHDDRSPSLTVGQSTTGILMVHCMAGCDWRDVKAAFVREGFLADDYQSFEHDHVTKVELSHWNEERKRAEQSRVNAARKLWAQTLEANGSPVEAYLRGRGIDIPVPPTIRYLPNAKHSPTGLILPAMVAVVSRWPGREIDGIHRTFLTNDGTKKAPVSQNKMMLGRVRQGAVRLSPASHEMIITEGIETGLSVLQATEKAVWCGLSAGGIEKLVLPELLIGAPDDALAEHVTIAADNDPRGIVAAQVAAERMQREGRTVRITTPPEQGQDFNDLLGDVA